MAQKQDAFTVEHLFNSPPLAIFEAWLDSDEHTEMTGSPAQITDKAGAEFSAWDGYITGRNVKLEKGKRIVQRWRTTEFPEDAPDSLVEITLTKEGNGCRLSLHHSEIPAGQGARYKAGWSEYYFQPMMEYFLG